MIRRMQLSMLLVAATTAGCAIKPLVSQPTSWATSVVTAEDIRLSGGTSALDGVRLLQTRHLMGSSPTRPRVYIDDLPVDYETLGSVHLPELESIEYLDPTTARIRYGMNHEGGAIVVRTVRSWQPSHG